MQDRPPAPESNYQQQAAAGGNFAALAAGKYMLLTTFKPDGTPVSTTVHGVVDGDRAYFGVLRPSGTAKRLRSTKSVQVTPCIMLGFVSFGPLLDAVARPLSGEEVSRAASKLTRKYPVQERFLVPLLHRMRRWQMVPYELLATMPPPSEANLSGERRAS